MKNLIKRLEEARTGRRFSVKVLAGAIAKDIKKNFRHLDPSIEYSGSDNEGGLEIEMTLSDYEFDLGADFKIVFDVEIYKDHPDATVRESIDMELRGELTGAIANGEEVNLAKHGMEWSGDAKATVKGDTRAVRWVHDTVDDKISDAISRVESGR